MTWLNELKVAIVTKDTKKIDKLTKKLPEFESVEQMQEGLHLIKEAFLLVNELKNKTQSQLTQIKKNIDFLESTAKQQKNSLDIFS